MRVKESQSSVKESHVNISAEEVQWNLYSYPPSLHKQNKNCNTTTILYENEGGVVA